MLVAVVSSFAGVRGSRAFQSRTFSGGVVTVIGAFLKAYIPSRGLLEALYNPKLPACSFPLIQGVGPQGERLSGFGLSELGVVRVFVCFGHQR